MGTSAGEILTRLRARGRRIDPVQLPDLDAALGLVVLTQAEHQAATFACDAQFKAQQVTPSPLLVDAWNAELATQVLARALVLAAPDDKGQPVRLVRTADELRDRLTPSEQAQLLDAYYAHPDYELRRSVDAEQLRGLAEEIRRNPLASSGLDSATLRQLVTFLVGPPST